MDDREEQLRQRAYGIWQAEGQPHGRDRDHWEMAEREITEGGAPEKPVEATARPARTRKAKSGTEADGGASTAAPAPKPKARKPRAPKSS